jgi:hypothetical protein
MQKIHLLAAAAVAASFALAGCNNSEPVVINKEDPMAEQLRNAAPVAPPPMIQVTRTYRCRDNSLLYVDFYTNNTAAVRTREGEAPVAMLNAEGGNPPYTGSGYSVSGSGTQVSITAPGHGTQSCHT